ncbi:hypothetical protein [Wocania ichthyoenteri]|uniref:hypothetical protein n=1 Tax=Wocania ichthyoenteri TaxID=1230531 RepID=UPI00053F22A1|nr:hypothetical protein [Wocania ichthyoenteri]
MDYWYYYLGVPSLIAPFVYLISIKIKEKEKRKRIKLFEKMDNSKIKAIGDYEKNSKLKNHKNFKNKL